MTYSFFSLLIFANTLLNYQKETDIPVSIEHVIDILDNCRNQSYIDVTVKITYIGESPLLTLGLKELIPSGTSYYGITQGDIPHLQPPVGTTTQLEFAWIVPPHMPTSFTYRLKVNSPLVGENTITAIGIYGSSGDTQETPPFTSTFHCAGEEGELPTADGEIYTEGEGEGEGESGEEGEEVTFKLSSPEELYYLPEKEIEIIIEMTYPPTLGITALGAKISLPDSWSFLRVKGGSYLPQIIPQPGEIGELGFAWITIPPSGTKFSILIRAGNHISPSKEITGCGLYRILGGQINTPPSTITFNLGPLPDLAFLNGEVYPDRTYNGGVVEITYFIKNLGSEITNTEWYDCIYLSNDEILDEDDILINCEKIETVIHPGKIFKVCSYINLPSHITGRFFLISKINARDNFLEPTSENNTGILGTLELLQRDYDIHILPTSTNVSVGSPVKFKIFTYYPNSNIPSPNKPVDILFSHRFRKIESKIQTDDNGEYTYTYLPFPTEGGVYLIEGKLPSETFYYTKAQTNLSGIGVSPSQLTIQYIPGKPIDIPFYVINLGDEEEKNISIYSIGLPQNWDAEYQIPTNIPGNTTKNGKLTIYPNTYQIDVSTIEFLIHSEKKSQASIQCKILPPINYPKLEIYPSSLNIIHSREKTQIATFEVKNLGGIESGSLSISIFPQNETISLITEETIPNIKPGESFFISIQITNDAPLPSPQEYSLIISSAQTGEIIVPIKIEEEANVNTRVKVVDKTTNEPIKEGLVYILSRDYEVQSYKLNSYGEVTIETNLEDITSVSFLSRGYRPYTYFPLDGKLKGETLQIYLERIPIAQIISFLRKDVNITIEEINNIIPYIGELTPELEISPVYIEANSNLYSIFNLMIRNNSSNNIYDILIYPNLSENKKIETIFRYVEKLGPHEKVEIPAILKENNSPILEDKFSGIRYRKNDPDYDTEIFLPINLWNTESIQSDYTISYSKLFELISTSERLLVAPTAVKIETEDFYYSEENTSPIPLQFTIDPYYPILRKGENINLSISSNISSLEYSVTIQVKSGSGEDISDLFSIHELTTIHSESTENRKNNSDPSKTFSIIPLFNFLDTEEKEIFVIVNIEYSDTMGNYTQIVSPKLGFLILNNSIFEIHEFFPYVYEDFTLASSNSDTNPTFPLCYTIESKNGFPNPVLITVETINLKALSSGTSSHLKLLHSEINFVQQQYNQLTHILRPDIAGNLQSGLWLFETPSKYIFQNISLGIFEILGEYIRILGVCNIRKHDLVKLISLHEDNKMQYYFIANDDLDPERYPDIVYSSRGDKEQIEKVQCNWFNSGSSQFYGIAFQKNSSASWIYLHLAFPEEINDAMNVVKITEPNGKIISEQYYWINKSTIPTLNIIHQTFESSGAYYVQFSGVQENNTRPVAVVSQTYYEVFRPNSLLLDGTASYDEDGDELIFRWQLASKPFQSLAYIENPNTPTPLLKPDVPGEYKIELRVSDGELISEPIYVVVNVPNRVPVPSIKGPNKVHPKSVTVLDASETYDPDGDRIELLWRITSKPNGSRATLNNIFDLYTSFTPDLLGTYEITLYVSDGYENTSVNWTVEAYNNLPIFTVDYSPFVYLNQSVYIYVKNLLDPDNDPISLRWSLLEKPEGSALNLTTSNTYHISFIADKRGIYKLILMVDDTYELIEKIITINCVNRSPIVNLNPSEIEVQHGKEVTIDGSLSYDPDYDDLNFTWELTLKPIQSSAELYLIEKNISVLKTDAPGNYRVRLTADDGYGGSDSNEIFIYATNTPPICSLQEEYSGYVGVPITIHSIEVNDSEDDHIYYTWFVSEKPYGSNPILIPNNEILIFIPDKKGIYKLELEVSDEWGKSSTCYTTINIGNRPPIANPKILNTPVYVGDLVTITSVDSFDPDGDTITSYEWELKLTPAGSSSQLSNLSEQETLMIPDKRGLYIVGLKVSDGVDWSSSSNVEISPVNRAPVAQITSPDILELNQPCILSGENSYDLDNDNINFNWRIVNKPRQSSAEITNTESPVVTFIPDYPGFYTIRLTVNDGELTSAPAEATLRTLNLPPVARISAPTLVVVGQQVKIDGSGSYDPDGDPLSYRWQLISKPPNSQTSLSSLTDVTTSIYIDQPGSYQIGLQVNDGVFFSEIEKAFLSTGNVPPIAIVNQDLNATVGIPCHLDGSGSYDPNGDSIIYIWSILEKPEESDAELYEDNTSSPYFIPDIEGLYVIQLIVSDGNLYSRPVTVRVTTNNFPPTAIINQQEIIGKVGDVIFLDGSKSYDPDGDSISFLWALTAKPEGSVATISNHDQSIATISIDKKGFYEGSLTVTDTSNTSNSIQFTISCINQPPVAQINAPLQAIVGENIILDASNSYDPDDDLVECKYDWKLTYKPINSNVNIENSNQLKILFTPDVVGTYNFEFEIRDPDSSKDIASTSIGVVCISPTPPTDVCASDGEYPDKIVITWKPSPNATEYMVFRSTENNPNSAVPISDWITTLYWEDLINVEQIISENPTETPKCGCSNRHNNPCEVQSYIEKRYYWVVSRSYDSCESTFSDYDSGYIVIKLEKGKFWEFVCGVFEFLRLKLSY